MLTVYLSKCAVLEDKCRNEAFNSQDTSLLGWDEMFEELASWHGVVSSVMCPVNDVRKDAKSRKEWEGAVMEYVHKLP